MLHKNSEEQEKSQFLIIKKEILGNNLGFIFCKEPIEKIEFLTKIIEFFEGEVIYLDFNFLYTGYTQNNIIKKLDNVTIVNPNKDNFCTEILKLISKFSKKDYLIIIDSLNNLSYDSSESVFFTNSSLMLLSTIGRQRNTTVLIASTVRKKDGEWITSPGGKQIVKPLASKLFFIKKNQNKFVISKQIRKNDSLVIGEISGNQSDQNSKTC